MWQKTVLGRPTVVSAEWIEERCRPPSEGISEMPTVQTFHLPRSYLVAPLEGHIL